METTSNNVRKEVTVSALTVEKVYVADFQKENTLTAQLRQSVLTKSFYPSASISNSLSENIFSTEDFGFSEQEFENEEKRVTWINVPLNSTVESVTEQLKKLPDAKLYRVMSNRPIIADSEQHAIENPDFDVTVDTFANKQIVRYPAGTDNAGQLTLDNGKPQYRRIAFSRTAKGDVDLRTKDSADFYTSPEIKAEMNGTVHVEDTQSL